MISGIVFDVDGVLFDTEPLHVHAWIDTARQSGFSLLESELASWTGKPCRALAEYLAENNEKVLSVEDLLERKERIFRDLLVTENIFNENIRPLLKKLSSRFPLGWASSSPKQNIALLFRLADISHFFKVGVCLEEVRAPKPDPESYRTAARKIRIRPEKGIALDDSPSGVASAVAAGFLTLGIEGVFKKRELEKAFKTFPSTENALRWIIKEYIFS